MSAHPRSAVVVGAGLGGLAVALRLAARGWRVTVCEQSATPGGKMNRWTADGFRFDTGPSLITMPWIFEELFAAAGERLPDHLDLLRVEPLARYVFADGVRLTQTGNLPEWLAQVRALEGGDASGFLRYLALGARLFEVSRHTFFRQSPFERRPPGPAAWRALRHLPLRHAWGAYHATTAHFFRSAHLRQLFDRYITYVGSSPYRTPATLAVVPYLETACGGWHIRGGLYRLVEVLGELLRARGVEVRTRTRVTRIRTAAGRATGVELADGGGIEADTVVFNGDAARLPDLLGRTEEPPPARRRSLSGLIFLFALRRTHPDLPHHSVYFSPDYAEEFRDLFDRRRFPDQPTVYVNIPSRSDRTMTPGEGEVVFVMANAPANAAEARWETTEVDAAWERIRRRLLLGGLPDFSGEIRASSVWTPQRLAETYDQPGGAIYGDASHGWRGAFLRPPNRHRRVRRLYLVGGSTHPGGGTPTVLLSADITAQLIQHHESF